MRVYKSNWRAVYRAVWYEGGKTAAEYAEKLDLRAEYAPGFKRPAEGSVTVLLRKLENAGLVVSYWVYPKDGAARLCWKATGRRLEQKELDAAWDSSGGYNPFL